MCFRRKESVWGLMMDSILYMFTVYTPDGRRVELGVRSELEAAELIGKRESEIFGSDYTYKVWECKEVEVKP